MIDWGQNVLGPLLGVFGEAATYAPATGAPFAIIGIFDEAYRELSGLESGIAMTTEMPVLGVRVSDFPASPLQGDQLTLQRTGVRYVVREVRLDGHGYAKLMLNDVT